MAGEIEHCGHNAETMACVNGETYLQSDINT